MNKKPENHQHILILSDIHSSQELDDILTAASEQIAFERIQNDQVVRSPFADPTVLAALITAGATTVASLITLIGVLWSTRQKEKKASDDTVIEIKVSKSALETLINKAPEKLELLQAFADNDDSTSDTLQLPVEEALELNDPNNPYTQFFEELAPAAVEHIAILEDN